MSEITKVCREHHFGSDGRCSNCQMKSSYYYEAMGILNSWSKKSKADPNEHWQEKVDSYKCNPHLHVTMTTKITIPNDNPIRQLYDMESY
jgi:hypothetical protein